MPALVQMCIVIVTIAIVAIAVMTVRMMTRINKATEELTLLTQAVCKSVAGIDVVTEDARLLVSSVRECVPPLRRVVDRFADVGKRTADLSSTILNEFEPPVLTAAAVVRGVRSGADYFLNRLLQRFTHRYNPINGGNDHV